MNWQASRVSEARRVRDQRLRDMPLVVEKVRGANWGDVFCWLVVIAFVGALMVILPN